MPLIIEDGTNVAGANSYVTVAEVRAYAVNRGVTLPADDAEVEPLVFLAMDWFESHEFQGYRAYSDQPLSFPRGAVVIDGIEQADDSIPDRVKTCVIQATIDANTLELQPSYAGSDTGQLQAEKVDVLSVTYFKDTDNSRRMPTLPKLQALIDPLLSPKVGFFPAIRV